MPNLRLYSVALVLGAAVTSARAIPRSLKVQQAQPTRPDIRADTNRDGVVDVTGTTDVHAKNLWTPSRGAIFLPNIGDALGRCTDVDARGNALSNIELAACNDASGEDSISPEFFAPLRTLPMSSVGNTSFAHVATYPEHHASHVRVFWQPFDGANWTYVDPEFRFNASAIRAGLTLGLDSRHVVTDAAEWDGSIHVRFTVHDGSTSNADEVAMKLAPVLFHHHLQAVDTLITQLSNDSAPSQQRFVKQLDAARAKTSVTKPLRTLSDSDIWIQDIMEPGYCSMPGPNGKPILVRVLVRTAESTRTAGRQVFTELRGRGVGAFQPTGKGTFGFQEINSGGNIETIPPYVSKVTGEKFPVGRIITGKHHDLMPAEAMLTFYESQGLQKPLILETGWLVIGHVDEFISFLPANNSLGFTIAVADSILALEILRKANASGFGKTLVSSVGASPDGDSSFGGSADNDASSADGSLNPVSSFGGGADNNATIADVLQSPSTNERVQKYASRYIEQNLAVLLAETGLNETDIIRVPTLFTDRTSPGSDGISPSDPPGSPPHFTVPPPGGMVLAAFYPGAVNGVVLGRSYIGPQAFGPVINGTDIFQAAVSQAYKRAGMDAHFIDDFYSHHSGGGEVHCGSNTLRETAVKWW